MIRGGPRFRPIGDRAVLVEVGDSIHPLVNQRVRDLFMILQRHPMKGILEMVPAYRSLMIVFDPLTASSRAIEDQVQTIHASADPSDLPQPRTIEVPVLYGGEEGPDLEWVAHYHSVTPQEVIRLHTGTIYQVYMIGFSPGFPYMGELPDALDTPRRATPRVKVPQGSVAIAQRQTGIYPVSSPGGWQILGRTPLRLFDPTEWPPTPLQMGDRVKFIAERSAP